MPSDEDVSAVPAREKHPRGACWSAWYFDRDNFETHAERLRTRSECLSWLNKLNELEADDEYLRAVIDRLDTLR